MLAGVRHDMDRRFCMEFAIGAHTLTVADLLRKQVIARADAPAIEDARGTLSYRSHLRVNRAAHMLLARGVVGGDRIAVLAGNRREYHWR